MGDKQDKFTIKLPGKSLLIFILVASCVFVVYYFANMVTDLQNDTNKKSDLVWLQKILNERKRPQNQHRPLGYKSRFDDYDDEDYLWDTTSIYSDYSDNEVGPTERKFLPYRHYEKQQRKHRPFRKQSAETGERSNSQPLIENLGRWSQTTITRKSQWYFEDKNNEKLHSFDGSKSAHTSNSDIGSSSPSESFEAYTDWLGEKSDLESTSYTTTTAEYSSTRGTFSQSIQSSSVEQVSGDSVSEVFDSVGGVNTDKSRITQDESISLKSTWLNGRDKLSEIPLESDASLSKPFLKEEKDAVYTNAIDGNEIRDEARPTPGGKSTLTSGDVVHPYKHKWSIDHHVADTKKNSSHSKQPINDSIAALGPKGLANFDSTRPQVEENFEKSENIAKARVGANTLTGTLTNRPNSVIIASLLKKQESNAHLNGDREVDEIASLKKNINFPEYMNAIDWKSEPSVDTKLECVPMSTLSSYVRICIHPLSDDQDLSARIRAHMGYEFEAMRDVQLAIMQDTNMGLIDLGAGIGEYSLAVARLRRHVVAVEPYSPHVKLLKRSVHLNKLDEYVTLIKNVISDKNEEYGMRHIPGHINDVIFTKNTQIPSNDSARSITLNQLSKVIPFKKAVLKIDVPNFTKEALMESNELFDKVDIKYVFTHWRSSDVPLNQFLVGFFQHNGYQPAIQLNAARLRWENYKTWPYSAIIWQRDV